MSRTGLTLTNHGELVRTIRTNSPRFAALSVRAAVPVPPRQNDGAKPRQNGGTGAANHGSAGAAAAQMQGERRVTCRRQHRMAGDRVG
jgi:hypothetical protein